MTDADTEVPHILDSYEQAVSLVMARLRRWGVDNRAAAEDIVDHLRAEQEHRETEPEGY